jgi:ribose 5-phosphate isomerase
VRRAAACARVRGRGRALSAARAAPRAALGIPLATLDTVPLLDVAIDGSDEARRARAL